MTSYHPRDIEEKYCGNCHVFHDQIELIIEGDDGHSSDNHTTDNKLADD